MLSAQRGSTSQLTPEPQSESIVEKLRRAVGCRRRKRETDPDCGVCSYQKKKPAGILAPEQSEQVERGSPQQASEID